MPAQRSGAPLVGTTSHPPPLPMPPRGARTTCRGKERDSVWACLLPPPPTPPLLRTGLHCSQSAPGPGRWPHACCAVFPYSLRQSSLRALCPASCPCLAVLLSASVCPSLLCIQLQLCSCLHSTLFCSPCSGALACPSLPTLPFSSLYSTPSLPCSAVLCSALVLLCAVYLPSFVALRRPKPFAACCVLRASCCVFGAACSVLRVPCCVLRAACSVLGLRAACAVLRAPCCVLVARAACSVLRARCARAACSVLPAPCCVLRAACSVLRAPCCVLVARAACSVLRARCSCCVLRAACSVLRARCSCCLLRAACSLLVLRAPCCVLRAACSLLVLRA